MYTGPTFYNEFNDGTAKRDDAGHNKRHQEQWGRRTTEVTDDIADAVVIKGIRNSGEEGQPA